MRGLVLLGQLSSPLCRPFSRIAFFLRTLTLPAVQESLFSTPVPQAPAVLLGHGLIDVEITDPAVVRLSGLSVHRGLARRVEGSVDGTVLTLTAQQLAAADAYEVDAYTRRRVLVVLIGDVG